MINNALISSFFESGWFGRAILIILFILSIYAWAIIAMKWRMMKDITIKKNNFLKMLTRTQGDIISLYQRGNPLPRSPFQNLYETICEELNMVLDKNIREEKPKKLTNIQLDNLFELANSTISNILISLEKYLIVLSTTASVSPLLGLLGTVWGILISFRGMATFGSANLSVIAPGISTALVTTVAGLIVAIPALIGYNWITNKIQILTRELENFSSRMLSYIQSVYSTQTTYEKELAY